MIDCDTIFLIILTGLSFMILAVDFKILEKMFEEFFKVSFYLPQDVYEGCYKPQAEMRIVFECYAIYSAVLCTILTGVLAVGASDDTVEWVALKIVNISFIIYGPMMTTICLYGFYIIKGLSTVCTINGISKHTTNYVSIFVLGICFLFSISCTFTMVMEKTFDMARSIGMNENSVLYRIT
jgi:hypothetical protein